MKFLIVISGATAIGKTHLAISLAQHFQTEIISSDSRQFFKEMEIGTAVPNKNELAMAPHHFIQHKSIFEKYSVGDFERDAIKLLNELFLKHNLVIMVGGSGLYTASVLNGLDEFPDVPESIRLQLKEEYNKKGILFLQEKLKSLDPLQYTRMDIDNPQRVIRALEVCIACSKPYSSFLNKKNTLRNFIPIEIGLTAERSIIYNRINQRVEAMLESGLIKEVQSLHPYKNLNALQTVGYRELFDFFDKKTNLHTSIENIKKNTRNFAKRQNTWFQKQTQITWFDYQSPLQFIIQHIEKEITKRNR
ncbi:tRNA (adenosine(37)-N6)-dimethylallyltransferase MiaA [Capnocytophaga catalasegens]|uniref:tRNA dimethylallyltransferase n=1 Tax=Capnocytophaga catalasegens TaxID=1004260 RepID=A0AAV5AY40_9FLAO|nr:tRNA (adenosine(37)-N6)-dimethylallyltransferase MiaA [Capnocytophaga catalasegens]GIZ16460.1 tRNA dimethylallyltransferase [Capnocytophaga catalasegens]GJM50301.1 tRNA dimethylallyltransferase [Capnocytophaga catalasegens]GJM53818.1 tRNA dimethylallyltransferase [Capnocytophaga catalasegens]